MRRLIAYEYIFLAPLIVSLLFVTTNGQFILYKTDRQSSSNLEYDCLYYRVSSAMYIDDLKLPKDGMPHEIIAYCMRPTEEEINPSTLFSVNNVTKLTFAELYLQNITANTLLLKSAPIELAEQYQQYIDCPSPDNANQTFINCPPPWFGSACQYTFEFSSGTISSFAEVVKHTFQAKWVKEYAHTVPVTNLTCYRHLECYRGPEPMCLDWREICDGKIDCVGNGLDEESCLELEANECAPDDYRCHNGMCISDEFLRDDPWNPECLDGTDEGILHRYPAWCPLDPTFRCEERACRRQIYEFACGDGQCDTNDNVFSRSPACHNGRQKLSQRALLAFQAENEACWSKMTCLLGIVSFDEGQCEGICKTSLTRCIRSLKNSCPGPFFFFPSYPVLLSHVYFLFSSSRIDYWANRAPDFVCYDSQLCPFLPWTMKINGSSCIHVHDLGFRHMTQYWHTFIIRVHEIFSTCGRCHNSSSNFFQCNNGTKCISIHRLVDGVNDCIDGSDEKIEYSCTLTDSHHRFECPLENKSRCIAPLLIQDHTVHCTETDEDEITSFQRQQQQRISFGTLCDGFIHMSDKEQNETDETNCELWPCNNLYTRCDNIWNCLNGADELQCYPSSCRSNEHPCLSIQDNELICLPLERTNDGIVDCRGAVDERMICRSTHESRNYRYLCLNDTKCIGLHEVCDVFDVRSCPLGDDEWNCPKQIDSAGQAVGFCHDIESAQRSIGDKMLCSLSDEAERSTVYFSLSHEKTLRLEPVIPSQPVEPSTRQYSLIDHARAWSCNRGIPIKTNNNQQKCLCPSSYYGSICQYQNQRVSLTLSFRTQERRTVFNFVIILTDSSTTIYSYDQIVHIPSRDCNMKYQIHLLYQTRPKSSLSNYSVQIDLFEKETLNYRSSWRLPIHFSFLPVNRLSAVLTIPIRKSSGCTRSCQHGLCSIYEGTSEQFCQCDSGWFGPLCETEILCTCSVHSRCVGFAENRSICVCPTGKYGPRCYLNHMACDPNPCKYGGKCVPTDAQIPSRSFTCFCPEGFSGSTCELRDSRIDITFEQVSVPNYIQGHIITVQNDKDPLRTDVLKKVPVDRNTVILYISISFHILFVQIYTTYYLLMSKAVYTPSTHTISVPTWNQRCAPLHEVLNTTLLNHPLRRRVKYYHVPCQQHRDLLCFYDETFMCLCTDERHANCFEFVHNITSDCQDTKYCGNAGTCIQDHPLCPTTFVCVCAQCYYGSKCQFTTEGSGLSLDTILGYHISPHVTIHHQPSVVQVSIAITTTMFAFSLLGNTLCILIFRRKMISETGCGFYLLMLSIVSLLTMTVFILKFWLLVLSQMKIIIRPSTLYANCVWTEFFLKCLPHVGDWLSACVAMERALTIYSGANFNKKKSKRTAKWIVAMILLCSTATAIHDPLHRQLIDDAEEQRTWCIPIYSSSVQIFNRVIYIIHFFGPFIFNFVSASLVIIQVARQRFTTRQHIPLMQHLWQQLCEHKHLIISPCILIILALPRLIISFIWDCLKSVRDPRLFLAGYFLSFIPPVVIFIVFVLPSKMYKKELSDVVKHIFNRKRLHQYFNATLPTATTKAIPTLSK
ncbi:unnamed protein product [Adineta ricciae]|uniref:Uncharacterized protein n=1 Tax=Adineta ricciae TaxID=249248 RepID=A0A816AUG1_ADIRI|nr:unnamed protein product [Adineta ricciae]CAF1599970.1 unnamed protein product [Adineta ricciae]